MWCGYSTAAHISSAFHAVQSSLAGSPDTPAFRPERPASPRGAANRTPGTTPGNAPSRRLTEVRSRPYHRRSSEGRAFSRLRAGGSTRSPHGTVARVYQVRAAPPGGRCVFTDGRQQDMYRAWPAGPLRAASGITGRCRPARIPAAESRPAPCARQACAMHRFVNRRTGRFGASSTPASRSVLPSRPYHPRRPAVGSTPRTILEMASRKGTPVAT